MDKLYGYDRMTMVPDVTKHIDFVNLVEEVSQEIFRFYHFSSRRRREVNQIADALDDDAAHGVYFAAPKGMRWVASRSRAYKAISKNYEKVILHYEDIGSSNRKGEEAARCKGWLKKMKQSKFIEGLNFLSDVLAIITPISLVFQRDDLFITDVVATLDEGLMKLEGLRHAIPECLAKCRASIHDGKWTSISGTEFTITGTGLP